MGTMTITVIIMTAMWSITMTINSGDGRLGLRRNTELLGMQPAQATVVETSARQTRLKRLILIGALASFMSLFGLTIAVDQQTLQPQQTQQPIAGTTNQLFSSTGNSAPIVSHPHVRTRTS